METAKTPQQFQVQDFLLSITSQNSILTLEAKSQSSGKIFTVSINNDVIAQITNGLFDSAESLAQGLRDAASGSFPDLKITIDFQGKLTYTMIFSVGTRKREDSFSINLAEKEPKTDSQSRDETIEKWKEGHERRVSNLEQAFHAFQGKSEERFNRLENMILQMEEKMNQRFNLLIQLNQPPSIKIFSSIKPATCFNAFSMNKERYDYSSDNTSVRLLPGEGHYPCLDIDPQIPSSGQHSYSIKINMEQAPIAFGITMQTHRENWNDEICNYRYLTARGIINGRVAKKSNAEGPFGGTGKTVRMMVDMDDGILTFFVDGKQVNKCKISTSETYFAYVSLGSIGDSVTLI